LYRWHRQHRRRAPLWDAVEAQLAGNAAQHNAGGKTRQPSLLAGMLLDGCDGNRMTLAHFAVVSNPTLAHW
jgi:hypothetical protein